MSLTGIDGINLKVVVIDTDFYALQSINGYLAWDRRTRVMCLAESLPMMWEYLERIPVAENPDVIVLDSDHVGGSKALFETIQRLRRQIPDVVVVCLAQFADIELVEAAADAGARAYLLKQDVRLHIAWAIVYALDHSFVVTHGIAKASLQSIHSHLHEATHLPEQRDFPEMTERIKQAIKLCVIEGLPAHLAADEMSISLHTIRGYIKEGYRILEAYDETEYPIDMTPQERAFMRFTALADEEK